MKTINEWLEILQFSESDIEDNIRAIQSDAHHAGVLAGMTEAAEIAKKKIDSMDAEDCAFEILSARDAKQPAPEAKG